LIQHGALVNEPNNYGWTALHLAIQNNDSETIKTLLKVGANFEAKKARCIGGYNTTPLALAARLGHVDAAQTLLKAGADIEGKTTDGRTALAIAAYYGKVDAIHVS
jgi:ankyrin repeat protein